MGFADVAADRTEMNGFDPAVATDRFNHATKQIVQHAHMIAAEEIEIAFR